MLNQLRKFDQQAERKLKSIFVHQPWLAIFLCVVGMPIALVIVVGVVTAVVMYPISLIFGWV